MGIKRLPLANGSSHESLQSRRTTVPALVDAHPNQKFTIKRTFKLHLLIRSRSDEDDPSGSKYTRMEDDSIQDKERFAR